MALARSLAPRPALLLLDEPLSALDRNLRRDTREELVRLQRELGIAFILVTHDQEEALTMADRIGVMHAGRLMQVGTPAEVYERPNSRLVAEFLGAANVLPIVVRNGRIELAGGMPIEIATAPPSDAAWLAIRPERMTLGATDAANRVAGVVVQRSYAGETLTHLVRLADGSTLRATVALRQGLNAAQAGIGDTVTLSWDAGRLHRAQAMIRAPGRTAVLAVVWAWLLALLILPTLIVVKIAFSYPADSVPPYAPMLRSGGGLHISTDAFSLILTDPLYARALLLSLKVAGLSTAICLLAGYPMALAHRAQPGALAQPAASAGDAAVLDRLPDAHQCMDRPAAGRRLDQHGDRGVGSGAVAPALHRHRHVYRHDLYLPAVHGAAALRAAVAARRATCWRPRRISARRHGACSSR